ncbi:stage III sporulation protein AE [Anaeropeptidivorans aminofermentans]|jgi:stage III sporulation protein AE|uniref:stage III sporulation protein AE n=1 Tax=Anaeropeptidivorans aminofermentans TaxID=2934315 RepID=UPI0020249549|nr:stage III sporulation protein AE [Anaeropeptidivorans aminofermentans]MBE6012417.1 hypothetical protein [Lachnospiraceae bacterium]
MKKIIILSLILIAFIHIDAYAYDDKEILGRQLDALDFSQVKSTIQKSSATFKPDFDSLVKEAIAGELDISFGAIVKKAGELAFSEFFENMDILKELILIGILSALLKNLTFSFKNKSVGEMGFYITYIALVMVLFSSFKIAYGIFEDFVVQISAFIQAAVPLMVSLIIMSGNVSGGYVFNSLMFFSANLIITLIKSVIMPLIMVIASVNIINYLTENEMLTNFSKLMKDIISWLLKLATMGFMFILSIQRISVPVLNNIAAKTAKTAVNAVPVVGETLTGAVDIVMFWANACKSGVSAAVLIAFIGLMATYVIKIGVFIVIYKLTAAVIQPICDKRIVECINTMGSYAALMLSSAFIVALMFVFSVMIVLSF